MTLNLHPNHLAQLLTSLFLNIPDACLVYFHEWVYLRLVGGHLRWDFHVIVAYLGILALGCKAHDRAIDGTDKETASLCGGLPRRSPVL